MLRELMHGSSTMLEANLSPASSELMSTPNNSYNHITDTEFSNLFIRLSNDIVLKQSDQDDNALTTHTNIDFARLNLVISDDDYVHFVLDNYKQAAERLLGLIAAPDMHTYQLNDYPQHNVLFERILHDNCIHVKLVDYLQTHLNQESLLQLDNLYAMCRANFIQLNPDKFAEISAFKLRYCRQLKIIDASHVDVILHCYSENGNQVTPIAKTTLALSLTNTLEVNVAVIGHDWLGEPHSVLSNSQVRQKMLFDLIKNSKIKASPFTKELLKIVEDINQHVEVFQQRIVDGVATADDKDKMLALLNVAKYSTNCLVKVTCSAPLAAQRRARGQLKNCLVRNAKMLNKHRSLLLSLWNAIVNIFAVESTVAVQSFAASKATAIGFFSSAKTCSLNLAERSMRACALHI
jgi:hypothetical protein